MKAMILPAVLLTVLSGPAIAADMTKEEIVATFSGKLVEGYHDKKKFTFKRYYDPEGDLYGESDTRGKRKGRWSAQPGQLCEGFKKIKCHRVERAGKMIKKYNRKETKVVVTFRKFMPGQKPDW